MSEILPKYRETQIHSINLYGIILYSIYILPKLPRSENSFTNLKDTVHLNHALAKVLVINWKPTEGEAERKLDVMTTPAWSYLHVTDRCGYVATRHAFFRYGAVTRVKRLPGIELCPLVMRFFSPTLATSVQEIILVHVAIVPVRKRNKKVISLKQLTDDIPSFKIHLNTDFGQTFWYTKSTYKCGNSRSCEFLLQVHE